MMCSKAMLKQLGQAHHIGRLKKEALLAIGYSLDRWQNSPNSTESQALNPAPPSSSATRSTGGKPPSKPHPPVIPKPCNQEFPAAKHETRTMKKPKYIVLKS